MPKIATERNNEISSILYNKSTLYYILIHGVHEARVTFWLADWLTGPIYPSEFIVCARQYLCHSYDTNMNHIFYNYCSMATSGLGYGSMDQSMETEIIQAGTCRPTIDSCELTVDSCELTANKKHAATFRRKFMNLASLCASELLRFMNHEWRIICRESWGRKSWSTSSPVNSCWRDLQSKNCVSHHEYVCHPKHWQLCPIGSLSLSLSESQANKELVARANWLRVTQQ